MGDQVKTDSWREIQHTLIKLPLYRAIADSIEWKDYVESGLLFFIFNSLLFLLVWGKYSIVTLISYLFLSFLVFCFSYVNLTNLNASKQSLAEPENPLTQKIGNVDFYVKVENVYPYVDALVRGINLAIYQLRPAFLCEHTIFTAKVACALLVTAIIGKCFTTIGLLYLGGLVLFIWPRLYHEKRADINKAYNIAQEKVHELLQTVHEKLPESLKKKLE